MGVRSRCGAMWLMPVVVSVLVLGACAKSAASVDPTTESSSAPGVTCSYPLSGDPARRVNLPPTSGVDNVGEATAVVHLSGGDVTITLNRAKAPCTVNSFESLAGQGYYDNTTCHRLVDTGIFILQCGDPTGTGRGGPGYVVDDELSGHETYPAGTVAMANTGAADSNGSQFFFVWEDSPLPPKYTVFGTLDTASLAVIQDIGAQGVSGEDETTPIAKAEISSVTLG